MDSFLGGLGLPHETLPGTIRSAFGSRFQPPFWVPLWADQRFSGRSACCRTRGCLTTILHLPCLLTIRRSEAPRMFGFGLQPKAYMCIFVDLTGSLTLVPEREQPLICLTRFDNRTMMSPPPELPLAACDADLRGRCGEPCLSEHNLIMSSSVRRSPSSCLQVFQFG